MKKIKVWFSLMLLVITGSAIVSCNGSDDDSDNNGNNSGDRVSIHITSDKSEVEADGKSIVTLKVVDNNGVDVTKSCFITNVAKDIAYNKGVNTFSFMENTESKYAARCGDLYSDTVSVNSKNRKKYELYKKQIAVFKLTGTWCVNCPAMTTSLKEVKKKMPGKIIEMALHAGTSSSSDPFHINETVKFAEAMGNLNAFPTAIFNLKQSTKSGSSSVTLRNNAENELINDPAICAIKVKTAFDESSRMLNVESALITDKGGEFELACAILQDGIVAYQEGAGNDYVHDNTALTFSSNFLGSSNKAKLQAGEESETVTFNVGLAEGIDVSKVKVIIYALTNTPIANAVNNIVECKVNSSVDYVENED